MKSLRYSFLTLAFALFSLTLSVQSRGSESVDLLYLNPSPGASYISPTTSIAVRQGERFDYKSADENLFLVTGNVSGVHQGRVALSDDSETLLFYPAEPFAYAETVTVELRPELRTLSGAQVNGTVFHFHTLEEPVSASAFGSEYTELLVSLPPMNYAAAADFDFKAYPELSNTMPVSVTTPASGTADGLIFITSTGIGAYPYDHSILILDDRGVPVYIKRLPDDKTVTDFKVQTVNGEPYLVYHAGTPVQIWSNGTYYVLDDTYTLVDTWTVGNGYGADEHELQLLENGHALMVSYVTIPYDLSPFGGPKEGELVDILIQEQDSLKNVVFEWRGTHHIPVGDSYENLRTSPVDYMHTNAIEVDFDGNLLISSRGLSEITKIDRETGSIVWRMGGKQNEFTFTNDAGFSAQHDIRRLSNGNLTLFDNGNRASPAHSRAVEYQITPGTTQITRVWQYPQDYSLFAPFMGGIQRLSNGNSIVGWGAIPMVTEVKPDGTKAFEMTLNGLTYRAFRFLWDAVPAEPARLVYDASGDPSSIRLHYGWNGATGINALYFSAGPNVSTMRTVADIAKIGLGFETSVSLSNLNPDDCYFTADPHHEDGIDLPATIVLRTDTDVCADLLSNRVYLPVVTQAK